MSPESGWTNWTVAPTGMPPRARSQPYPTYTSNAAAGAVTTRTRFIMPVHMAGQLADISIFAAGFRLTTNYR